MTDLVKRLREILKNATPGPWVACNDNPDDGPEDVVMAGGLYIASCHEGLRERAESNAALIALAPDLACDLIVKLERIEALEHEAENHNAAWTAKCDRIEELEAEVTRLSAELREARMEAIAGYGQAQMNHEDLAAMTEDRDKWAAESAKNLRSLAAMTTNAEALAKWLEYLPKDFADDAALISCLLEIHRKLIGRK